MEVQQLIGEIAKKHGLLLGRQDPTFALLTLNELVLTDYVTRCESAVEKAQDQTAAGVAQQVQLAKQIGERLVTAAGTYMAEHMKAASKTVQSDVVKAVKAELEESRNAARTARAAAQWAWAAAAIATTAALWMFLVQRI